MSVEKRRLEGERWLLQAEDDLEAARVLLEAGKYAQSAFMAQQAGEKAVKGLWFALGLDPWGNSLTRLVRELPEEWGRSLEGLLPSALALDKLYVPTRYPDALPGIIPKEAYTREEAVEALAHAQALIQRVRQVFTGGKPGASGP